MRPLPASGLDFFVMVAAVILLWGWRQRRVSGLPRGVYDAPMRRIQLHLDEAMDDELATEARRRGLSKAALIRLLLSQQIGVAVADPVDALIGSGDGGPVDDIDAVVYGR